MNTRELRDALEDLAGPAVPVDDRARASIRRRVRQRRVRSSSLVAVAVAVAVVAVASALVVNAGGTSPRRVSVHAPAAPTCRSGPDPVPAAQVPVDVASWAGGKAVVGNGAVWTIRSAIDVAPVAFDGKWMLKFPWFLRPAAVPRIVGRRVDGEGTFSADANPAIDSRGTWAVSSLVFSTPGCWDVTASYRGSNLTVRILFSA